MLKHATISRTSRAQQALQLHRHWQHQEQQQQQQSGFDPTPPDGQTTECEQHTQQVDLLDGRCHQTTDQAAGPANESSGLIVLPVSNHDESVLTNHESSPLLSSLPPLLLSTSRMPSEPSSSCCTSPTPSNQTSGNNTSKTNTQFSPLLASGYSTYRSPAKSRSTPSSLVNSPMKLLGSSRQRSSARSSRFSTLGSIATGTTTTSTLTRRLSSTNYNPQTSSLTSSSASSQESMIKVFAQALGQDVKYVTLPVNTQTKSQEIIKTLLKKYRQKHRDPNLFHLTLERWIRKDGLKFKSVMLLGDEACPLQLQQCCSNPPHDDIKFTLQMRSGALVKIYCSDVVPDAKYKCLSLSTQTTVEETIELMLHCLNLTSQSTPKLQNSNTATNDNASSTTLYTHHNRHFSGSPNPSSSSSSSSYDTSSSSGIESEPNNIDTRKSSKNSQGAGALDSDSRASSVASISSSSNVSSLSSSLIDQYCMVIERKNSNFTQTLRSDEYLVDVYQSLLAEASRTSDKLHASDADSATTDSGASSLSHHHHQSNNKSSSASQLLPDSVRQSSDQWFFIKLKRRYETENNSSRPQVGAINHVNPRQNMPLPPIPPSQSSINQQPQQQQLINSNHLRHFVSTTQIEVNRPGSSLAANNSSSSSYSASTAESELMRDIMRSTPIMLPSSYSPHLAAAAAAATGGGGDEVDSGHQAPPPSIILLTPPVRPRRRNLSNVSSTFVPHSSAFVPPPSTTVNSISNKRRYDQAQLIEDLDRLNIIAASSGMAPVAESG